MIQIPHDFRYQDPILHGSIVSIVGHAGFFPSTIEPGCHDADPGADEVESFAETIGRRR